MTVIITDNRTIASEFDSSALGVTSNESLNEFTSDPSPVESNICLGAAISIETSYVVGDFTLVDLTDTLVYVWVLANGTMDILSNGGIGLVLGDTTNIVGYHLAGSDVAVFRHSEGPVGWQCLVLDTSNLPASTTQLVGASAPTITTITQIGAMFKTLSKALGGASNCFIDIARYGSGGITITGGASGVTEGKFSEIATEDRSSTTQKAHGVVRELGAGVYSAQSKLTFGDSAGTAATYFADTDTSLVFEDRSLGTDKYALNVEGNATGSTTFQLGNKVGTAGGSNGCSLISPSGVGASISASGADVDFVKIYGSTISGFSNGIDFSYDATNGPNHEVFASTFSRNGQIDVGKIQFKNNNISSSTNPSGALILTSGTSEMSDISFTAGDSGHAIYVSDTGSYTFNNFKFSGFGASGTTDADLYNNSGGLVTVTITGGGDTPTYRNGTNASTSIVAAVSLTLSGLKSNSEVRVYTAGTLIEVAGIENSSTSFASPFQNGDNLDIRVFHLDYQPFNLLNYTVPSTDTTIPISQIFDRNYSNP